MEKVILVTPEDSYVEYFKQYLPSWDITRVDTITDMWNGLSNNTVPSDAEIVIFNEYFYNNDTYGNLEQAIETLYAHATVFVISYDPSTANTITSSVARTYGPGREFYFIRASSDDPIKDVLDGRKNWISYKKTLVTDNTSDANRLPQPKDLDDIISKVGNVVSNIDLPPLDKRGIIVASTSSKGGSGKTTVALCTASALYHASRLAVEQGLRERPFNVVVVDLDIRDGQVGFLLAKDKPTVLNLWMENRDSPEINLLKSTKEGGVLHYDEGLGIWSLLAPISSRAANLIRPEFFQKLIYNLSLKFDVVVVDTSVNYLETLLQDVVLPMVDLLMFVTNMSKGSIFGMTRWIKTLVDDVQDSKISKDKIRIVINQAMTEVGVELQEILNHGVGVKPLEAIPSDAAAVVKATNEYRLEDIVLRHETISERYYNIAKKIVKQMGQPDAYVVSPLTGEIFARKELLDKLRGGDYGTLDYSEEDRLAAREIR
jgi:MinD-like ATPase involved in chromosome partitioning or flagellar assembly